MLIKWNGILGVDSSSAALYEVFLQKIFGKLFARARQLPGAQASLEGWGMSYLSKLIRLIKTDDRSLLEFNPGTKGKTWNVVIQESLQEAWSALSEKLGDDPVKWAWGKLHHQTFIHNLGRGTPYDTLFNIPLVGLGGDGTTVFNSGGPYLSSFTPTVGVSFRMLLDFADLKHGWWILPPGQSGHPGSPHYRDGIEPWLKGKYWPMLWDWQEIKSNQEGTLRLNPAAVSFHISTRKST